MSCDSLLVLSQLVRTNLWAKSDSLVTFKSIVVDAESVISFLHKQCIASNIRRIAERAHQKQPAGNDQLQTDLYSSTIVNYGEFFKLVNELFDFFKSRKLEPIIVYEGKYREAPLFGLLAAEFTRHSQQVSDRIIAILDYDKRGLRPNLDSTNLMCAKCPSLAIIIFKSIVNARRREGAKISVHQAFYSPFPIMTKLARDYECPVLTNKGEFIIMDVRAGFILLDHLWEQFIHKQLLVTASPLRSPNGGSLKPTSKTMETTSGKESIPNRDLISFQFNHMFLHQHPGLNSRQSIYLFPLATVDFVTQYSKSLKVLKIFNATYTAKDFVHTPCGKKQQYRRHHLAANRLEMALTFLSGISKEVFGSQIRSEATRTKSPFDNDIRQLYEHYAVAHEFKLRLRFVLKYLQDPVQLSYIENCLINRELTQDNLLNLLCCSIGRLAGVEYNNRLQFEDLATKKSANSLLNHQKAMLMSLFSANKTHPSESSLTVSEKRPNEFTRYPNASLTIVDREKAEIVEHEVTTSHNDPQLALIRAKLNLSRLSYGEVKRDTCAKFINLSFNATDITQLPKKIESVASKFVLRQNVKIDLAILLNLFEFCKITASEGDDYFKSSYAKMQDNLIIAILNHHLYLSEVHFQQKQKQKQKQKQQQQQQHHHDLEPLKILIIKQDASLIAKPPNDHHHNSKEQKNSSNPSSKFIRHLLELLQASIESYCELNSFLNYPLPVLDLTQLYNPILMYNLCLHLHENPHDKVLVRLSS